MTTLIARFRYIIYKVWGRLGLTTFSPLFFFATGIICVQFDATVIKTCSSPSNYTQNNQQQLLFFNGSSCGDQRRALLSFVVYCCVRLISYKFEELISRSELGCLSRMKLPGTHLGLSLALPYLIRSLSFGSPPLPLMAYRSILFFSTILLFVPYLRDLVHLICFVHKGATRRFFRADYEFFLTVALLFLHFSIIFVEVLDISFGIYCPQFIFGIPILFPHTNFVHFLFLIHNFLLKNHKKMPIIIYEVCEEDVFVQLERQRCLANRDCPIRSAAYRLPFVPSQTTTRIRRELEGRIVQIRDLDELQRLVPCDIQHGPKKKPQTYSSNQVLYHK
ncbi:unnamed protein product, partial [Mesorhabditis belari]|uniref:Uncharacterized protein n=1 Tax=Mesorhabditis belari TaxID=2138241 RepID=A0AAF3E8G8_9BILA